MTQLGEGRFVSLYKPLHVCTSLLRAACPQVLRMVEIRAHGTLPTAPGTMVYGIAESVSQRQRVYCFHHASHIQ